MYISDIDRSCRIVIYEIDASNIDNVTIDKVGRLPLERSRYTDTKKKHIKYN